MSERAYNIGDGYRYGFNGQERDDEIAGEGNSNTAEFWQFDPRLGRRWNIDPVDQIDVSNYAAFSLNPIAISDPNGDCPDCPKEAKTGDLYATDKDLGNLAPNGQMLSGTDGTGTTMIPGTTTNLSQFMYRLADNGNWYTVGFQTKGGTSYFWDDDKQWYADKDGHEFDDHLSFDVTNAVGNVVTPIVNFAVSASNGQDPFAGIKKEFKNYDGNFVSFMADKVISGVGTWIDDASSGGHRQTQALMSAFFGGLATGPSLGFGANLLGKGTGWLGTTSKKLILGGASSELNFYTVKAMNLGYSKTLTGTRVRAGFFVQINHNVNRLMLGKGIKILYSNSEATIMGRAMQNNAIGTGLLYTGYGTFGFGVGAGSSNGNNSSGKKGK